jgi:hypothetical protein
MAAITHDAQPTNQPAKFKSAARNRPLDLTPLLPPLRAVMHHPTDQRAFHADVAARLLRFNPLVPLDFTLLREKFAIERGPCQQTIRGRIENLIAELKW